MSSSEDEEILQSHGSEMGRESGSSPVEWLLVGGNRFVVTAGILGVIALWFLGLNQLGIIAFQNDDSVTRLAGGMIAGTFSLVTLVVSINQMILSREFSSAGEARDRLDNVMGFRENIEEMSNTPASPASPVALFYLLVESINTRASKLAETVDDHDEERQNLIESYVSGVEDSTQRVGDTLKNAEFGTFDVVSAAANYNDAWQIYAARHLDNRYEDELSEETHEAFEELIDALELFNVARTHFKTTYMQRELTQFSRLTLYCGLPSVFSAMTIGFLYADIGGVAIDPTLLPYVVTALIVVVASPLALMAAYILRTATLIRRTASIGPIIPQKAPEDDPFDVSFGED
jgi:hypothetical protein